MPMKRHERPMLGFLSREEIDAVLDAPEPYGWTGQRDRALLTMLYNTGARVSEVVTIRIKDVILNHSPCVHLHGKGRKNRSVPLWRSTAELMRKWKRCLHSTEDSSLPVSKSWRKRDDALQRHPTPCTGRFQRRRKMLLVAAPCNLSTYHSPRHSNASAPVRRGHHCHCSMAGPREPCNDTYVRRSRSHHEAARTQSAETGENEQSSLPASGSTNEVPGEPINYAQRLVGAIRHSRHTSRTLRIIGNWT